MHRYLHNRPLRPLFSHYRFCDPPPLRTWRIRPEYLQLPAATQYTQPPFRFMEVQEKWRESDGVSRRWDLIYKAPMDNVLNYLTTYITISTGVISCAGLYYLLTFDKADVNKPVMAAKDVILANSMLEGLIYLAAFIGFHIALRLLLSKFVIRMYKDGDNYLAVYRGLMYNSIKKHQFKLHEFKRLKPPFFVSWGDARFGLGKKHSIILENYFKTPEYFNQLLTNRTTNSDDDT